ncbi:MAG: hypothetical protein KDA59_23770, partial [Planctomycetales bacterium]|nr:hypothetical protein [Planctomycetales bacterium]
TLPAEASSTHVREARVAAAYRQIFGREPRRDEITSAAKFLGSSPTDEDWRDYFQALLGLNEMLFVD